MKSNISRRRTLIVMRMKLLISCFVILLANSKPIGGEFSLDETCKNKSLCSGRTNIACEVYKCELEINLRKKNFSLYYV